MYAKKQSNFVINEYVERLKKKQNTIPESVQQF